MSLVDVHEIKSVLFDLVSLSKTSKAYNDDDKNVYLSNIKSLVNKEYVIKKTIGEFMTKDLEELHSGAIIMPLIENIKQNKSPQNASGFTYLQLLDIVFYYTHYITRERFFYEFIGKYHEDKELYKSLILILLPYIRLYEYVVGIYMAVRDKNDELVQILEENRQGGIGIKNNSKLMNLAKSFIGPIKEESKHLTHFHEKNNQDAISLILADKKREEKVKILRQSDMKNEYNIVQVLLNDKSVAEKAFRQYIGGNAASVSFPIYVPYVVNGELSFELNKKKAKINSNIDVYDVTSLEDINILEYLKDKDNIVVFILDDKDKIIENSIIALTKTEIKNTLDNKEFYYECKNATPPFRNNLKEDKNPYIKIKRQTVNYIPASSGYKMFESDSQVFGIKPSKDFENTTSLRSIQIEFGEDFEGEDVDFTSADHCQEGTDKTTNDVFQLDVTWKMTINKLKGGRSFKSRKYCRKCKTKH